MRKRNSYTVLEQAVDAAPEFETMLKKISQQVTLRGQSKSTMDNYSRRIALFVIHFNRLPEQVSEDEINGYLVALARDPKPPSRSSFKHMAYGLRYYYHLLGMNKKAIALPSLKQDTKLPVILFVEREMEGYWQELPLPVSGTPTQHHFQGQIPGQLKAHTPQAG